MGGRDAEPALFAGAAALLPRIRHCRRNAAVSPQNARYGVLTVGDRYLLCHGTKSLVRRFRGIVARRPLRRAAGVLPALSVGRCGGRWDAKKPRTGYLYRAKGKPPERAAAGYERIAMPIIAMIGSSSA